MTLDDILNAAKHTAQFGVWGASKLLAPRVGDPQEALLATQPYLRQNSVSPNVLNQPGLDVQPRPQNHSFLENILKNVRGVSVTQPTPRPTVVPVKPTVTPTPVPPQPTSYEQTIQEGFKNWGSPPAATLSGEMARISNQYPLFQKYPFLLPALTILETSGGKNVKRPNNWTNWGVYEEDYNPPTPEYNLDRMASGIQSRTPYYQKFRETGNLEDLANVYAPESDNPGTGGSNYANNLRKVMEVFENIDKKKKKAYQ